MPLHPLSVAVCGLPDPTETHAERAADFALGMIAAFSSVAAQTGVNLGLRVGLHSGSVTAGVLMGERCRRDPPTFIFFIIPPPPPILGHSRSRAVPPGSSCSATR